MLDKNNINNQLHWTGTNIRTTCIPTSGNKTEGTRFARRVTLRVTADYSATVFIGYRRRPVVNGPASIYGEGVVATHRYRVAHLWQADGHRHNLQGVAARCQRRCIFISNRGGQSSRSTEIGTRQPIFTIFGSDGRKLNKYVHKFFKRFKILEWIMVMFYSFSFNTAGKFFSYF